MKRKSNYRIAPFFLLVLLVSSCSDEREFITVEKNDIVESVYSSVVVEPQDLYRVNSVVSGYIDVIPYAVGDKVNANDVLFRIRDVQSSNNSSNAKIAYEQAKKNYSGDLSLIEDLKLELANTANKRSNDSINYFRNKELYASEVITKLEYEQSELMYSNSKNAHIAIENKIKRTQRELKSSLEQAKNNYNSSLARSEDAVIRNRTQGKIYDITKEEGEFVSLQEPIAIVGSAEKFTIKMLIDEVDITRVKIGQTIIVNLEAFGQKSFKAIVTRVSPKMDNRTQTFEVEGEFKEIPTKLYMGLTGEGNIIVDERENVLVVPREYLIDGKYLETESGRTKVTTGAISLSSVEIVSGLKQGTKIYKPQ